MRKPTNRLARGGFTLIEIMVVLVIMGFLVAMVAPKLAGVVDGASETTDSTSLTRFSAAVNEYVFKTGKAPSGLTNLIKTEQIVFENTGVVPNASILSISDNNPMSGVETLSLEFSERMVPMIHHLNAAEAKELKEVVGGAILGLEGVENLGAGNEAVVETYVRNKVENLLPVMMIGAGYDSAGTAQFADSNEVEVDNGTVGLVTVDSNATSANMLAIAGDNLGSAGSDPDLTVTKTFARIGEAKNLLRIVMGVSNRNKMVVEGFLDESGVSANVDTDNYTYGDYSIILPRLKATTARFFGDPGITYVKTGPAPLAAEHLTFQAIKYEELDDGSLMISARTPHMGKLFGGKMAGQSNAMTTVVDPMGHVIGERGGWFAAKITEGYGSDLDGSSK